MPIRPVLAGTIALCALATVMSTGTRAGAEGVHIVIKSGFQQTFALSGDGQHLFGEPRQGPIGPEVTGVGEITIGLTPLGSAAGVVKLHVFERTAVSIAFEARALKDQTLLGASRLCGRLDLDSWVVLPPETTSVDISGFAVMKDGCD